MSSEDRCQNCRHVSTKQGVGKRRFNVYYHCRLSGSRVNPYYKPCVLFESVKFPAARDDEEWQYSDG